MASASRADFSASAASFRGGVRVSGLRLKNPKGTLGIPREPMGTTPNGTLGIATESMATTGNTKKTPQCLQCPEKV